VVSGLELLRRSDAAQTTGYGHPTAPPSSYTEPDGADLCSIQVATEACGGGRAADTLIIWLTFIRALPRTCGEGRVLLCGVMYRKFRERYYCCDQTDNTEKELRALQNMIPLCGLATDEIALLNAFVERCQKELGRVRGMYAIASLAVFSAMSLAIPSVFGGGDGIVNIPYGIGGVLLFADVCVAIWAIYSNYVAVDKSNRLEEEYATQHGLVLADNG
jgi:hypothetical protein